MAFASVFATSSDPLLAAAYYSALAALGASLALVAAVLGLRWRTRAVAARTGRIQAHWRLRFAAVAVGEGAAASRPGRGEVRAVLELWNQTAANLKGASRERLAGYGLRCGFDEAAGALIRRRSVADRLLGLATLGQLADRSRFEAVKALAADPSPAVSLTAARALIRIDPAEALAVLLPQILDREDWPVSRLAEALRDSATGAAADLIALALERAPERDRRRLLALARIAPPQRIAPQVRAILSGTDDPETLIAALKLVADPRDAALVRPRLQHPDWQVRVAAVRALGRIAAAEDLPSLAAALADPSWWVRQRAADAIVSLPYLDAAQLADLRARVPDRYAADALERAMAEKAGKA